MASAVSVLPNSVDKPTENQGLPGSILNLSLLVAITLLATILRIHALTTKSFWLDEGISLDIATLPSSKFYDVLWHRDMVMASYYILLRGWLVLSQTEGFIRGLSVLFSVATIPAIYALAARLFNRHTGFLAAFLLAINAFHVRYAQEARSYAMVMFLATLATWLLVRNLQKPSSTYWGTYAAICVLAVYSHFYAALVVVAHCVALTFLPLGHVPWRNIIRSLFGFTLLMIPIAIYLFTTSTSLSWVPPITWWTLVQGGIDLAGNYGKLLLTLVIIAVGMAALDAHRMWSADRTAMAAWRYVLLFAWLFIPIAIVAAASLVRPFFVTRYLSPCLPASIILVAAGIVRFRPYLLSWTFCAAVVICSLLGTISYYHQDFDGFRQDWRSTTNYILDHSRPGDSIFFYIGGQAPFEYYRGQRHPVPIWPKSLNPSYEVVDPRRNDSVTPTHLARLANAGDRIWLVLLFDTDPKLKSEFESVMTPIKNGRHAIEIPTFLNMRAVLFARDPTDTTETPSKKY